MDNFITSQLDYIFFFYGLSFFLLAAVCLTIKQKKIEGLHWGLLTAFAIIHGLNQWLDLIALATDNQVFKIIRLIFLGSSFICIFEFARLGVKIANWKPPGIWVHIIPIGLILFSIRQGLGNLAAAIRYYYGFSGIIASIMIIGTWWYSNRSLRHKSLEAKASKRTLALSLWILTGLIIVLIAGFVFVNLLSHYAESEIKKKSNAEITVLSAYFNDKLEVVERLANTIKESPFIIQALTSDSLSDKEQLNLTLDRYSKILNDSVCYFLDSKGNCIASSNRNMPDSFVGKSYAFRPYFQNALKGKLATYFAYGITSLKRGYYAGLPVFNANKDILGVVVAKKDIDEQAYNFQQYPYAFLTNDQGVIFMSSKREHVFKSLWPIGKIAQEEAKASRQFGNLNFKPIISAVVSDGEWIKLNGQHYYASIRPLRHKGWKIIIFNSANAIILYRFFGIAIILFICILLIIFYFFSARRENFLSLISQSQAQLEKAYEQLELTQNQLLQSAKMASIGLLAGGIAHEINNPLTGILNNVQLLKMLLEKTDTFDFEELKKILNDIEYSSHRCVRIVQSLLNFSHSPNKVIGPISLNNAAVLVENLLQHEFSLRNIVFKNDFYQDLPCILGDPNLLQQAIFDLVGNAKWAIEKKSPKGGEIILKTAYDAAKKEIIFAVSDNGIGIPEKNIEKIFEPFFTTKEVGEGTGLGLSVVYSIVKELNGAISVESKVNLGTTFTIKFPVALLIQENRR